MAKLHLRNGQTSNIIRAFLPDSTSTTGAGKTGLTFASSGLIIATIADVESAAVAYTVAGSTIETITTNGTFAAPTATKCRFKEVDATNFPGVYEIQIADARFAVANARILFVSILCTGVAPVLIEIQQLPAPADIRLVAGDATAPGNLALAYNGTGYTDGTAQAGGAATITFAAGDSAVNSFYNGQLVQIVGGTGAGQGARLVTGYVGATKVATVSPAWTTAPDATSTYVRVSNVDILRAVTVESDGSVTAQQALSIMLAGIAGQWTAAGTFKSSGGAANRIVGTAAASAPFRSAITLTPSS